LRSAWSAELTLCSAKSSPIRRSRETTRFAPRSSRASSARCFGPPIGTGSPSTRTDSGPRIRNSRRLAIAQSCSFGDVCSRRRDAAETTLGHGRENLDGVLYAAKCFWPGATEVDLRHAAFLAGSETGERQTAFRGALYLPGDELALCLFESSSPVGVKRAS